jgi:hypothetical protein
MLTKDKLLFYIPTVTVIFAKLLFIRPDLI